MLALNAGMTLGICLSGIAKTADIVAMPTKAVNAPAPVLSPWTFSATAYDWVALLNGSMTDKGRTSEVDGSFNDLMSLVRHSQMPKDLFALMGYFEARNGRLCLHSKRINISTVLAGQKLGIKKVDDGIWLTSFMHYDLGYFDLEQKTRQPLDKPFGTSLSPMS